MDQSTHSAPSCQPQTSPTEQQPKPPVLPFTPPCDPVEFFQLVSAMEAVARDILSQIDELTADYDRAQAIAEDGTYREKVLRNDRWANLLLEAHEHAQGLGDALLNARGCVSPVAVYEAKRRPLERES